ncbi:MAG: Holliday junction resolvase RuvX [Oscillospiraceae bacterium]|jgi:putative Holliday junction resolvase|nr:Holliday junction resolvase RuvX [Oscillospiraceae bacterium]
MARIAGVDYGLKRIGVAVSDVENSMAFPLGVVRHTSWGEDAARLRGLLAPYGITRIVLGDPLLPNGERGAQSNETRGFGERLAKEGFRVEYMEEVYSSMEAFELLRDVGYNKKEVKRRIDQSAAALILTRYINEHLKGNK